MTNTRTRASGWNGVVKRHPICASALLKKPEIESVSLLSNVKVEQAAIRAGYSEKTAGRIGSENLQKLDIQNAISEIGIAGNC